MTCLSCRVNCRISITIGRNLKNIAKAGNRWIMGLVVKVKLAKQVTWFCKTNMSIHDSCCLEVLTICYTLPSFSRGLKVNEHDIILNIRIVLNNWMNLWTSPKCFISCQAFNPVSFNCCLFVGLSSFSFVFSNSCFPLFKDFYYLFIYFQDCAASFRWEKQFITHPSDFTQTLNTVTFISC